MSSYTEIVDLYEIQHIRQLQMKSWRYWEGARTFITHDVFAATTAQYLYGRDFPANLGDGTPTCYGTRIVYWPEAVVNVARVIAYYKTPLVPGRTIVRERIITRPRQATHEIPQPVRNPPDDSPGDPTPTEGPVCDGPDVYPLQEWRIVQGTNLTLDSIAEIEVETAIWAADYNLERLWEIKDAVNSEPFNIRGFIGAGNLLFKGFESVDDFHVDPIPVKYKFWYNPWGWNYQCRKQPGVWAVWKVKPFEISGLPDALGNVNIKTQSEDPKYVKAFIPGYRYQQTAGDDTTSSSGSTPVIKPVRDTRSEPVQLFYEAPYSNSIPDSGSW